jgi:TolB-like protein/Tfp pilus assembly protein PilF
MAAESKLAIGGYSVDLEGGIVQSGASTVFLRPKPTAVLLCLARQPGKVVSKAELLDAAWPGIHVTEDSLTQSIREIRKALADDDQSLVKTIARRGYMLNVQAESAPAASDQPLVAVMRFRDDPQPSDGSTLAEALSEDIIAGLSRFRTVAVLARHSSFALRRDGDDAFADAHARLGADFLVDGTLRRSGERFRLNAFLIDARTLRQLWSGRYDAAGSDIFAVLDTLVEQVIGSVAGRIDEAAATVLGAGNQRDLAAVELLYRGLAVLRANDPERYHEGAGLIRTAAARDPGNGLIQAHLAFAMVMVADFGRARRADLDAALEVAAQAVRLAPEQPTAYRVLSFIQMYRREYAIAEHHLRRALELNPFDADSIEQMGYLVALRGRPAEALTWIDRALRLNPIYPDWYDHDRALAYYMLGDYATAAQVIGRIPKLQPWMRTWLAACQAQMGQSALARRTIAGITAIHPAFSPEAFALGNGAAFEQPSDVEHFVEGVLLALGRAAADPSPSLS